MSDLSESLIRGAREALEYAKGNQEGAVTHEVLVPAQVDVMAIMKENAHESSIMFILVLKCTRQ